jgi:hypothetical protein
LLTAIAENPKKIVMRKEQRPRLLLPLFRFGFFGGGGSGFTFETPIDLISAFA